MGQIGVTQDNPWDYFISGFSSPEGRHLAIPHDMVLASGVNELNFLAARLEKLNDYEIGTLNAALQQKDTEMRTIWRIIDYADNLDCSGVTLLRMFYTAIRVARFLNSSSSSRTSMELMNSTRVEKFCSSSGAS